MSLAHRRRLQWVELALDYRCNNRCIGCYSVQDDGGAMTTREALEALARGRRDGADAFWIGGGDATLRPDLFAVVAAARRLGYARVKLQTNAMRLAHAEYARRCAEAGVTEVNVAIKGADAATHDRLTRTPGCHALMLKGIENARALGLALEGDLLIYRSNAAQIPEMVRRYTALGLERYNVWLMSAVDQGDKDLSAQVPRIADVVPFITAAMDLGLSARGDFITSLHTPPCTVPASHHACLFHAEDLALRVSNPGGYEFMLEESPIEGGHYLPGCARCALRPRCGGVRRDYLTVHGDAEFVPLAAVVRSGP